MNDTNLHILTLDTVAASAALTEMTSGARVAAKAQTALATTSTAATRAMKNMIAGFDELHLAVQDTPEKPAKGSSGRKNGSSKKKQEEKPPELPEPPEQEAAWIQWLRSYVEQDLGPAMVAWQNAFAQMGEAARDAFGRMQESAMSLWQNALVPLGQYLLYDFLPALVNTFSTTVAPILADLAGVVMDVFANGFSTACRIAEQVVQNVLLPALELIKTIFTDVFNAMQSVWETYGVPLMEGVSTAFNGLFDLIEALYSNVLQPVLQKIIDVLTALWKDHLAPLWENLLRFFAEAGDALLKLWNNVLQPVAAYLVEHFGPVLEDLGSGIAEIFGEVGGFVADVVNTIVDVLRELCDFLGNVFTGNWSGAWENVKTIFGTVWDGIVGLLKGAINAIITCVNAMIRGVASAINGVVGAINGISFTIPKWVPAFGGKSFGMNLPTVSAPQIPMLARGAVIPPNAAFLAVLGDQRHGRNLEAPESLIRQIIREESGSAQALTAEQPVELSLDGDVFYRAMMRIRAQRGVSIGGVFADAV